MIKLTILVPSVPRRIELFYVKLMKELLRQIELYKNELLRNIHIINYTLDDDTTNIYNIKQYKNDLTLKFFVNKGLYINIYPNFFYYII